MLWVSSVRPKGLSPERNAHVRAFVQELIDREFEGNVLRASKALGLSNSILYEFLRGSRGAGIKLLEALSDYTKKSIPTILGMDEFAEMVGAPLRAERRFRDIQGWTDAEQTARTLAPQIPDSVWKALQDSAAFERLESVDAGFVYELALLVWRRLPP
jgi:hypothetical protein